jgi:ubiquinone/menaquinone biosynthesis C-methylase UbiE
MANSKGGTHFNNDSGAEFAEPKTSVIHSGSADYLLGNSIQEQERLKLQAKFLQQWSEQFLLSAGLEPGMRVLDIGCGMGDVSLLAAKLVGPSGCVTGIDRDQVVIEKARERIRDEGSDTQIELVHTDLFSFQSSRSFDAVVGRYVLLYQPDPVAAIAHAAKQVLPGGIVFFHETDIAHRVQCYPDRTLFEQIYALIAETFRRSGYWLDMGLQLTRMFFDAGLPWPTIKAEVPVGGEPGSFIYRWGAETLRSLLPRIEEYGLGSAESLQIDTLVTRMEAEARTRQSQLIGPIQFGAWARTVGMNKVQVSHRLPDAAMERDSLYRERQLQGQQESAINSWS